MKKLYLVVALLFISTNSMAAEIPKFSEKDHRILTAHYDKDNVTEIVAKAGIATQIVLEEGEEHEYHAFGDKDAWHFDAYKNNIFIKPKEMLGTTNLNIITNKRNYSFKVNFADENSPLDMYQVRFIYPDVETAQEQQARQAQNIEINFETAPTKKIYNLNYSMRIRGDRSIAPMNVYDDGTFTYFKFAGNVDLPAVYAVMAESEEDYGQETLVNKTISGQGNNIIVMHKTHYLWRLRLGDTVIDVFNDSMDKFGVLNTTGTVSPDVERVDIGGAE